MDALSDDGLFGITIIAFIGSVFSPYYRKAGRTDPDDHCALNVALYGPRGARWAMTEHGRSFVERKERHFSIGNSTLHWEDGRLTIDIDEVCTPFPRRIRGRVIVETEGLGTSTFMIDDNGRHRWRPLAPLSRIRVDLPEPGIAWSGDGYLDRNEGDEPLEDGFVFWDWSRTIIDREKTAILYNTDMTSGHSCLSAFLVDKTGRIEDIDTPPPANLPPTNIWRVKRRTRAEDGEPPRILKTFEDTPFYSRSVIETNLFGARRHAIHESLSGPRLDSRAVQFMLPYRMPRKA
jgi:carotenoid 1,2-hydratase